MWPWEHVAFGYVLYSLGSHAIRREPPAEWTVFALGLGTLVPDLVDKPLSWSLGLFPTGYSVAHSALVAVPTVAGFYVVGRWTGRDRYALAFGVGYLSHLVGDVVYPVVLGGSLAPERVLWPVVALPPYEDRVGFTGRALRYLLDFLGDVLAGQAGHLLAFEGSLALAVLALWLYDGRPGVDALWSLFARPDR